VFDDLRVERWTCSSRSQNHFSFATANWRRDACRFTTLLGWVFPLPHYRRIFGFALSMPPIGPFDSLELTTEIVRHLADRRNGGVAGVVRPKFGEIFQGAHGGVAGAA